MKHHAKHPARIVITGGPGGGKTTALDLFRREIGDRVAVVPEVATMLFSSGLPRPSDTASVEIVQSAIYQMQHYLEDLCAIQNPGRMLLCDRGTIDGAAYWPGDDPHQFFHAQGTTLQKQLERYDAVLFLESAAVGGMMIQGNNPTRTESLNEAVVLDTKLRQLWSQHPRFVLVPHNASFFKKISAGLAAMENIVSQLQNERDGALKTRQKR